MEVQEILSHLERNEGHFARSAVREAVSRRDEIIPPLLEVLESAARDPQSFARDPNRMIHLYAMYLLAQFRESRAYPLLVQMFSAPGELPFDLAGDTVTEGLDSILASVSDGDMTGMASLVENERANEYVRSAALKGLVTLVACGKRSRDEVMAYFKGLFRTLEPTYGLIWNSLASRCTHLCPEEMREDLRQVHEQGLIDPFYLQWEDIEGALSVGKEAAMKALKERYRLIDDAEKAMSWWACFEENKHCKVKLSWNTPIQKAPKVGRNDYCPCGSGKKFKKCCGP